MKQREKTMYIWQDPKTNPPGHVSFDCVMSPVEDMRGSGFYSDIAGYATIFKKRGCMIILDKNPKDVPMPIRDDVRTNFSELEK